MWLVHCAGTTAAQSIIVDMVIAPIKSPIVGFSPKLPLSAPAQNSQAKKVLH